MHFACTYYSWTTSKVLSTPLHTFDERCLISSCLVYFWLTGAHIEASGKREQTPEDHYQGTCPLETEAGWNWNKLTFDFTVLFTLFLISVQRFRTRLTISSWHRNSTVISKPIEKLFAVLNRSVRHLTSSWGLLDKQRRCWCCHGYPTCRRSMVQR